VSAALALLLAVVLDALVGDPRWLPHPIRWMGLAIETGEPWFRRLPLPPVVSGGLMAGGLILFSGVSAWGTVALGKWIHPYLGFTLEAFILFYCLSVASLAAAARAVWRALIRGDMTQARAKLAMIVGRETADLEADGVARAAVETVAENLVDGIIAPLFWAALGGAPLALAYKMINTLDSMVGYKNERYLAFGKVAARVDDVANWLPARLSVPLIALAAAFLSQRGRTTWRTARQDGRLHSSPNAGWPEAAYAGALGVWLGGANRYHGRLVEKPTIGKGRRAVSPDDIPRACDLMWLSATLAAMLAVGGRWVLG
jgi:adenosylcobinamide-phosphate synthase